MYTYEITSQTNGIATVEFSNGETETYTEQVTISDAQFATEETPFIPPVIQVIEHTRPKVIVATFPDDADLNQKITAKLNELNGVVEPLPEPTPEELERNAWLEQFQLLERSLRAKEKLEAVGLSFSTEEQARFDALVTWVADNRKIEYVQYM